MNSSEGFFESWIKEDMTSPITINIYFTLVVQQFLSEYSTRGETGTLTEAKRGERRAFPLSPRAASTRLRASF